MIFAKVIVNFYGPQRLPSKPHSNTSHAKS